MLFVKLKTHFSQDLLLLGYEIFPWVMVICLDLIKHIALAFNTLLAPAVCILRAKLWKVVMKCKIFFAFNIFALFLKIHIFEVAMFISPCTAPVNPIFPVIVWIYKIQVFDEHFFTS